MASYDDYGVSDSEQQPSTSNVDTASYHLKKSRKMSSGFPRPAPQPHHGTVMGKRQSVDSVRGCRRDIELFVTRIHRSTSFQKLEGYISRYVTDSTLEKIYHPNATHQSFVLTVPVSFVHDVLDPYFWPTNIECRRFHRPMSGRLARGIGARHSFLEVDSVERGVGVR